MLQKQTKKRYSFVTYFIFFLSLNTTANLESHLYFSYQQYWFYKQKLKSVRFHVIHLKQFLALLYH